VQAHRTTRHRFEWSGDDRPDSLPRRLPPPARTAKPILGVLTAALVFGGTPAHGAVLNTDRHCYRAGEPVKLSGGPFSPSGAVDVSLDGAFLPSPFTANQTGTIAAHLTAPSPGEAAERPFRLAASDRRRPALSGSVTRLVSKFGVKLQPSGGSPAARRRIAARGFTAGGILYAHVVRRRARRTLRIGPLAGACGSLNASKRLLRRGSRAGRYTIQFDARRRYRRNTVPRATYEVRVRRKLRLR
jgi:hypothetical protein